MQQRSLVTEAAEITGTGHQPLHRDRADPEPMMKFLELSIRIRTQMWAVVVHFLHNLSGHTLADNYTVINWNSGKTFQLDVAECATTTFYAIIYQKKLLELKEITVYE